MTPDPQLTSIQSDLVALLHEIGGVIEEELTGEERYRANSLGWTPVRVAVRLVMTGDDLRRVRVVIGPYADVEWEVIGEGSC